MEHFARVDALGHELLVGRLNVGDDQRISEPARRGRRDFLAERDRAPGTRGRELDEAKVVSHDNVAVEPPPEPCVELLCTVHVGDGYERDLELHVGSRGTGVLLLLFNADSCLTHVILLCLRFPDRISHSAF